MEYEQLELDFDYAEEQYRRAIAAELTKLSQELELP